MLFGKVKGTVSPGIVYEGLEKVPLLWVEPMTDNLEPTGKPPIVAADATKQAGPDQLVYYEGGREAALALDITFVPVDHAIIGIIDNVNQEEKW